MQAVILAAGMGSRLGGAGGGVPKCLLEVGRRPLVEHQLEALSAAGVGPVALVVGYGADEVRERVGLKADYVHNPEWATTNSLYSFWMAREWVKGGVVVLNSDILFDPRILDRLLAAGGDALAYDSGSGDGREHMKVKLDGDRVCDMRKDLPVAEAAGENVGMLCFTEPTARAVFDRAGVLVAASGKNDWLGSAVREVARDRAIRAVDVAGLPWGEVDFPFDLDRARKEVWPAIVRAARRRRPARRAARWAALAVLVAAAAAGVWRVVTPAPETTWDSVELQDASPAILQTSGGTQRWSLVTTSRPARALGVGPGRLQIESRLVPAGDPVAPYVLEISVDGRRLDWFKHTSRPSRSVQYEGKAIGKSRTLALDLTERASEVTVKLVAADSGRCLVRVLGVVHGDDEDDDAAQPQDGGAGVTKPIVESR